MYTDISIDDKGRVITVEVRHQKDTAIMFDISAGWQDHGSAYWVDFSSSTHPREVPQFGRKYGTKLRAISAVIEIALTREYQYAEDA